MQSRTLHASRRLIAIGLQPVGSRGAENVIDPCSRLLSIESLSGGTMEQVAMLLRLAYADLLVERGRHAMLVLDDAPAYSDRNRLELIFDTLTARQNAFKSWCSHAGWTPSADWGLTGLDWLMFSDNCSTESRRRHADR